MPSSFGRTAESEMISDWIFPPGDLATILLGGWPGFRRARVRARYELGLEGNHCPIRCGARAQGAGAGAWRVLDFLPDVIAISMMIEATAGAWDPGAALLHSLYYFPGAPSLFETRSGLKGLESHYWAVSTCSQVCMWMRIPVVMASTLELVPLPPKATQTPTLVRGRVRAQVNSIPFKYAQSSWQWLPPS